MGKKKVTKKKAAKKDTRSRSERRAACRSKK